MRYLVAAVCLLSLPGVPSAAATEHADILLVGGAVIDGSGAASVRADVALRGDRIVGVGELADWTADWVIDCSDRLITPGFIDLHNHADRQIIRPETRAAMNYLTQGCTTIVTGNCGSGPVDVGSYYESIDKFGAGPNVAHLLPQGSLRSDVMGLDLKPPTDEHLQKMKSLTEAAMRDGAWGMSTGLIYVPSSYADTAELIELASIVARHGGLYASHIRGEGTGLIESVEETLRIGAAANVPVHISHFKSSGRDAWGLVQVAARRIAAARSEGRRVTADQYPYIASSTSLEATLLPSWARAGGRTELLKRFDDTESGPRLMKLLEEAIQQRDDGADVRIARFSYRQDWVGRNLKQIAELEQQPATAIALEVFRHGGAQIVHFGMNEDDVRAVMTYDWVATASDGRAYVPAADRPHPRNYGTFPRKLGYYSLQEAVIPIEAAVRSATGLPAEILGLTDRGFIRKGLVADIAVLDPATLKDQATFDQPHQHSTGVEWLFVNGVPTIAAGRPTGALAGKSLRHIPRVSP